MEAFQKFPRAKGAIIQCISNEICTAYIFIVDCLSPFYLAYFQGPQWQKCFEFRLGDLDIFWLGKGEGHYGVRLQETQSKLMLVQASMKFCFVYMKISLLLDYGTIIFNYGMILLVVKRTVK